ncbi:BTAD domain-containing putative transcriptional regulator [Streptomyces sp. NPDC059679]|uniref:AfsR/SARP family transcriptional regulator n=1 Tax=Streptomyces sp. NPDC059679 TaxID=3346903 RepID=UPI0036BE31BE
MQFRILGPIAASHQGQPVHLGPPKQRFVLAVLLAEARQAVTVGQLIDRVWGQQPPRAARKTLHSYITRIRAILPPPGGDPDSTGLIRRTEGYVLNVPLEQVDLHRFRKLTAAAGALDYDDHERACALLRDALALWRAEPLDGLSSPWAEGLRTRLDEEHVAAWLQYSDVALRSEVLPDTLVSGLREMVTSHPLDERLSGQLMTALYRCGRQAEALQLYERIRKLLAVQLGIDPSPDLQTVYAQVLAADPALNSRRLRRPTPYRLRRHVH